MSTSPALLADVSSVRATRRARLAVAGLIVLSIVPLVAGAVRIGGVATGEITAESSRFVSAPVPILVHVVGATVYALLGAFQFAPGLRRRHNAWHRGAGMLLIPAGFAVALSGMWMTATYALPVTDNSWLSAVRYVVGTAMTVELVLAVRALLRHEYATHGAWMTRAYALALGAGTQVITMMPMLVAGSTDSQVKTILMTVGWGINAAVAEWVIVRRRRR